MQCWGISHAAWKEFEFAHDHGNYLSNVPDKSTPAECLMYVVEITILLHTLHRRCAVFRSLSRTRELILSMCNVHAMLTVNMLSDHISTRNKPHQSLFGARPSPPPLQGLGVVVLVHTPVRLVFTPAQSIASGREANQSL